MESVEVEAKPIIEGKAVTTPKKYSYEQYRRLGGALAEETFRDAIAKLQSSDASAESFPEEARTCTSKFEDFLKTTFSPEQKFLYSYLREKPDKIKPYGLCDRELLGEVLKMTEDLDTYSKFLEAYKPPPPKSYKFSGTEKFLEPIFRLFRERQGQLSRK